MSDEYCRRKLQELQRPVFMTADYEEIVKVLFTLDTLVRNNETLKFEFQSHMYPIKTGRFAFGEKESFRKAWEAMKTVNGMSLPDDNLVLVDVSSSDLSVVVRVLLESITIKSEAPAFEKKSPVSKLNKWSGRMKISYDRAHRNLTIGDVTKRVPKRTAAHRELLLELLVDDYNSEHPIGVPVGRFQMSLKDEKESWTERSAETARDGLVKEIGSTFDLSDFITREEHIYRIPNHSNSSRTATVRTRSVDKVR